MDAYRIHQMFEEGSKEIQQDVVKMTNLMMYAYQRGFKVCWKMLTGLDFDSMMEENPQKTKHDMQYAENEEGTTQF